MMCKTYGKKIFPFQIAHRQWAIYKNLRINEVGIVLYFAHWQWAIF